MATSIFSRSGFPMGRRTLVAALCAGALFSFAPARAEDETEPAPQEAKGKGIAILPLDGASSAYRVNGAFGSDISDEIQAFLINSGKIRVIEDKKVKDVLKKLKFNESGIVDRNNAPTVGGLSAVRYVLVGTVNMETIDMNAPIDPNKIVDTVGKGVKKGLDKFINPKAVNRNVQKYHLSVLARIIDLNTGEAVCAFEGKKHEVEEANGGAARKVGKALGPQILKSLRPDGTFSPVPLTDGKETAAGSPNGFIEADVLDSDGKDLVLGIGARDGLKAGTVYKLFRTKVVAGDDGKIKFRKRTLIGTVKAVDVQDEGTQLEVVKMEDGVEPLQKDETISLQPEAAPGKMARNK